MHGLNSSFLSAVLKDVKVKYKRELFLKTAITIKKYPAVCEIARVFAYVLFIEE